MQIISASLSGIIENKEKVPVGLIQVFDTSYTVPSRGFYVSYYSGAQPYLTDNLRRTQFESTLSHDWGGGLPVELSNYVGMHITNSGIMTSDPFSITYSGYFYADTAGSYNFATRSNMGTEIYLDYTQVLTEYQQITPSLIGYSSGIWPNKNYYWGGSATLTTGWHNFQLNAYWIMPTGFVSNPFISAFYTHPINKVETLLSPSVVNYQPQFLTPTVLSNVIYAKESIDQKLATQYEFEVAMQVSGVYAWDKVKEDYGSLKINRLCKVFMGYVTQSGYAQTSGYTVNLTKPIDGLVEKFTGMIDSVQVDQKSNSITAAVKCRDFFKKSINSINENYPNRANYTPKILSGVDPAGIFQINTLMPLAYDRWQVFDLIETLALNSNIDPSKINKAKWDNQNHFTMEGNLNWPHTSTYDVNGVETKNGDPYIFTFPYGERLFDEINKVADLIGYNAYFDESGDLVVKEPTHTNKIEIYESGNYGSRSVFYSGSWTPKVDINTSNRLYTIPYSGSLFSANSAFRMNFSGVGCGLYETVFPSGNLYSVDIYDLNNSNQLAFHGDYTNHGLSYHYGYLQEFTRDLPYGNYDCYIRPSGELRIEGMEYYTQNIFRPLYTIKDDRDISTIQIVQDDSTVRNEIIGVGQQTSDKGYLYSKAVDIDSISNPDAFNYVGEKRTFTFIEPTIKSQGRLDWLTRSILNKFRQKARSFNITTQGLPFIQINDPIGIKSDNINLNSDTVAKYDINNNEVYYVTNIANDLSQGQYASTLTLTSLKPVESWRPALSINADILSLIYQDNNNTIFANFKQDTLNSAFGYGYDGFSQQAAFLSFDLLVDVDRLWVLVSDDYDGGSLFKNIDINNKSPLITYQIGQGQDPNAPPQGGVWLHNGGGENWGRIFVPTAQNAFNGGQWAGQNSLGHVRLDGAYPLAIWAQFRTSDNTLVYQGIWTVNSGSTPNGNFTSGWSTTSSGNTYLNYGSVAGQQSIQTPINPSLQPAILPAFAVADEPLFLDIFIGPEASGYQMVSQNKLLDMSNKFMYGGNKWGSVQQQSCTAPNAGVNNNGPDHFSYVTDIISVGLGHSSISSTDKFAGERTLGLAEAWSTGDNILNNGDPPSIQNMMSGIDTILNLADTDVRWYGPNNEQDYWNQKQIIGNLYKGQEGGGNPIGQYITDWLVPSQVYKRDKTIFGWGPQGFDVVPVSQVTGYIRTLPLGYNATSEGVYSKKFGEIWGPIPSNNMLLCSEVVETVCHPANYILVKTNHDIILTYYSYQIMNHTESLRILYRANETNKNLYFWEPYNAVQNQNGSPSSTTAPDGSSAIPVGGDNQSYFEKNYNVPIFPHSYAYTKNQAFRTPLAIYLDPGNRRDVTWGQYQDPSYVDYKNKWGYNTMNNQSTGNQAVDYFNYSKASAGNTGNDAMVLHFFSVQESKSGRRYYFNMRTNGGAAFGGVAATSDTDNQGLPPVYLRFPLFANIDAPFVAPRIIQ